MGSVGKAETYYDFSTNPLLNNDDFTTGQKASKWWVEHTEISNASEWEHALSDDEKQAVTKWAGSGYENLAELYSTEWDNMSPEIKQSASNLYEAINKFETKQGITVNRQANFQIFGQDPAVKMDAQQLIDHLNENGTVRQSDGFMSFSTATNGVSVDGSGLIIHLDVPPNKGMGAYISHVAHNAFEREYLLNNNAVLKFDPKSVWEEKDEWGYNLVHVNAKLLGRAKMQTIDSKNK